MKRPLILSLAIAFALNGGAAFALGLGPVHVKSRLNQPLDAEIPVVQGSPGEAQGLIVQLASAEDFDRVGLDRERVSVPLEFSLGKNARGEPVVKVTSTQAIREPVLDFLVEANWPNGRLLREYTVLLDPPTLAPARTAVASQPAKSATRPLATRPEPHREPAKPVVHAAPTPAKAPVASSRAPAASRRAASGEYGPVAAGETLWDIAKANRADDSVNLNRMMLAFARVNPDAFINGNINALKRGAILRVPDDKDLAAAGSASEAAAEVSRQTQAWRGGSTATRVASSTPVADQPSTRPSLRTTGDKSASSTKSTERLALVPPKAGKESLAASDTPGSGGSKDGKAATQLRADLARTREALSSREQESTDLKARVKELEDISAKSNRLIGLKDSEIADLQRRLEELRSKPAAAGTTASATSAEATVAATSKSNTPVETVTVDSTPASTPASTSAADTQANQTSTPATGLADKDIWGKSAASESTPSTASETTRDASAAEDTGASASSEQSPQAGTTGSDSAVVPEVGSTTAQTPTASVVSEPLNTASSTTTAPGKPVAKPTVTPAMPARVASAPWYMQPWVKIAGLVAGVLLVLLGLLGLRRRRPAEAPKRASIAGAFGDGPPALQRNTEDEDAIEPETEEEILRRQLADNPDDIGLHLELLSLYYAENDVAAFEAGARDMADHVGEDDELEWQQVKAMGAELAPDNPLFADAEADADTDFDTHRASDATTVLPVFDDEDDIDTSQHDQDNDFDFDDAEADADAEVTNEFERPDLYAGSDEPAHVDDDAERPAFEFNIPPVDDSPDTSELDVSEVPVAPKTTYGLDIDAGKKSSPFRATDDTRLDADDLPGVATDEELMIGEDAVGTKLDLARAYLDMGDPEGARAMLDEVLGEGDATQQDEARRLIDEIE